MISKETARKIYNAHFEIEKSELLITEMNETIKKTGETKLLDAFGERRGLELGIPTSDNSRRLLNVPPDVAINVILAHIETQKRLLNELMALAKIELSAKEINDRA